MFPVEKMCPILGVSKSGYYKWLKAQPSKRAIENQELTERIKQAHQRSKGAYGSPRITEELRAGGQAVSRPRVARLMRQVNLRSVIGKKKYVATTDSKHSHPVAENLLERNFQAERPGQVWLSDITYIATAQGWLYLTIILDLALRKVIGWALSTQLTAAQTSVAAFRMAAKHQPIRPGLLFHSDRGVQYACVEFRNVLAQSNARQSMSRKADCYDNAVAESFFKTLKVECVYQQRFESRAQAGLAVFEYIECWYNTQRRHSALGYLSPVEFEQLLLTKGQAA